MSGKIAGNTRPKLCILGALPLGEGGGAKHSPPGHGKTSLGTLGVMILRTSGSGSEDSGLQM